MRNAIIIMLTVLACSSVAAGERGALAPIVASTELGSSGELQVEIHSPSVDFLASEKTTTIEVEGVASTIGGVRYLDMMLVLDASGSLRKTDPHDFRSMGAIELVQSLSPKSDMQIGVVGFDKDSDLTLPLTSDRDLVVQALALMERSGGTDLADGILAALGELQENAREGSSRVIVLFTDGQSNRSKAREATRLVRMQGITIQTVLLGSSKSGAAILEEIALSTGGGFIQVTDPSKLPEAFVNLRTTGVDSVTLSVNGSEPVPAKLAAGTFSGTLPLQIGENRIVALATSMDQQTKESVITVNVRNPSCAALDVAALRNGLPALSLNERAVEILVDTSRSMWGHMNGQPKMVVAKEILQDVSQWLPDDLNLALRAYGNSSRSEANDCADSMLLVPFGDENREPIREAISGLRPLGQTPIAYALSQAVGDFGELQSERAVVLLTDGIESCGGDPVAAARELRELGITIHLIGFGLGNAADEDTASLQAIADASGGRYLSAGSAKELKEALAVTVGTRYRIFKGDDLVADGALGSVEPVLLPSGEYRVRLDSVPPVDVQVVLAPMEQLKLTLEKTDGAVSHSEQRNPLQYTSCSDNIAAFEGLQEEDLQEVNSQESEELILPISNATTSTSMTGSSWP